MIRLLTLTSLLLASVSGAFADECQKWFLEGVRPGMTMTEARSTRKFQRVVDELGDVGYARYMWVSPQRTQEGLEIHIDLESDPPIMFGVTSTVPKAKASAQAYEEYLIGKWGPPTTKATKGPYDLYSWVDRACDVMARATFNRGGGEIAGMAAVISLSRREGFAERMRAAEETGNTADAPAED